ncbi:MAG: hypothetical protein R3A10_23365 [Caldilineaceae bacterium]
MPDERTLFERIANRFFAVPAVAQWWAKPLTAGRTDGLVDVSGAIPFAEFDKPLPRQPSRC